MSNKPRWLQQIADFLIDNLAILATIAFAGYIIYRQEIAQAAVPIEELLTAVLAVLGLMATSEIVERYRRLNSISKAADRAVQLLESHAAEHPSAIAFFQKPPSLDDYIQSANQIDLCGVTLTTTINKQFGDLRERLQSGAKIRILLCDSAPDSLALKMSAARSITTEDADYYQTRLNATLRDLGFLFKSWDEFKILQSKTPHREKHPKTGSLEVRMLCYAPSFGIISLDANHDNGIAFIEIYPHKFGYKSPPTFDLTPERDGNWYKYFLDQYEEMWNGARPWTPPPDHHSEKIS